MAMGQGGFVVVTIPAELFIYLELCCTIELTCFSSRKLHVFFFHARLSFWDEHRPWYILMCGKISGTGPNISCQSKTMVVDVGSGTPWTHRMSREVHACTWTPTPQNRNQNLKSISIKSFWIGSEGPEITFPKLLGHRWLTSNLSRHMHQRRKGEEERDPLG